MAIPSRLGRYPVRRRIGAGAFATVWLAHDDHLDSEVAVKVLADNWAADLHVRRRFVEEGRYLRKVESPHVVSVFDAGELDDGRPFLVMTYADRGTLADRLAEGPLDPGEALEVVRQVGEGLHALHVRGILHRDVKPANVLFRSDPDGRVRVMVADLGLGKDLDMSSRLTVIGGTPTFVSPEQARGERLDGRADQFSLAALTHLLLTGRAPWAHASLSAAAEGLAPAPLGGDVTPAVDAVVRRALAPDREDRWPDVPAYTKALGEALVEALGEAPAPPATRLLTEPARRRVAGLPAGPGGADASTEETRSPAARARRRPVVALAVAASLVAGLLAGVGAHRFATRTVEVADDSGTLSVTVPRDWGRVTAVDGWTPPGEQADQPALSAGTAPGWRTSGEGVFVGLLEADELPTRMPAHAECEGGAPVDTTSDAGTRRTVVHRDCPGVVLERVEQVTDDRLLWVQVRSDDPRTATRVLDSVGTSGL